MPSPAPPEKWTSARPHMRAWPARPAWTASCTAEETGAPSAAACARLPPVAGRPAQAQSALRWTQRSQPGKPLRRPVPARSSAQRQPLPRFTRPPTPRSTRQSMRSLTPQHLPRRPDRDGRQRPARHRRLRLRRPRDPCTDPGRDQPPQHGRADPPRRQPADRAHRRRRRLGACSPRTSRSLIVKRSVSWRVSRRAQQQPAPRLRTVPASPERQGARRESVRTCVHLRSGPSGASVTRHNSRS